MSDTLTYKTLKTANQAREAVILFYKFYLVKKFFLKMI